MQYGYIAMFKGKREEIYSDTLYHAKVEAIKRFKPPKKQEHMVVVMLAEKDGKPVIHSPCELG